MTKYDKVRMELLIYDLFNAAPKFFDTLEYVEDALGAQKHGIVHMAFPRRFGKTHLIKSLIERHYVNDGPLSHWTFLDDPSPAEVEEFIRDNTGIPLFFTGTGWAPPDTSTVDWACIKMLAHPLLDRGLMALREEGFISGGTMLSKLSANCTDDAPDPSKITVSGGHAFNDSPGSGRVYVNGRWYGISD